jgi:RecA/RadA recombinase
MAQQSLAAASQEGAVAYIDLPARLDPEFLSRLETRLDRLLIVRPKSLSEAMAGVRVLARAGIDFMVIDLPRKQAPGLDAELPHLLHRMAEAECTVLMVYDADPDDAIRYYASLIVSLQRSAWVVGADGDLKGLQIDATVVKNRLAAPGRRACWTIPYPIT